MMVGAAPAVRERDRYFPVSCGERLAPEHGRDGPARKGGSVR